MERGLISLVITLTLGLVVSAKSNEPYITVNDTNSPATPCLKMAANLELVITYLDSNNNNKTKTDNIELEDVNVDRDRSSCSRQDSSASLVVIKAMDDNEDTPYSLMFNFTANNSTKVWNFGNMTFTLEDEDFLDGYDGGNATFPIEFTTKDKIYDKDNADISFDNSFSCARNQSLMYSSEEKIQPFLNVSELKVQVFSFNEKTTDFGSAQVCFSSSKANKIVPIAVGAALAGLVVVVLIAYLIGRLRSRRQSSYEALS